jgi:hypothetical protein
MQRLLSWQDSGYSSSHEESTGESIGKAKLGNLKVWFAKGPLLRTFEDRIRPSLFGLLRHSSIPTTKPLFLRLYMVGTAQGQVKPVIVVVCVDPSIRKQSKTIIKESGKLSEYPNFSLSSAPLPLESSGVLKALMLQKRDDAVGPNASVVGRLLSFQKPRNAVRYATGGPILWLGERKYQLTVDHVFDEISEEPDLSQQEDWDLDECELEEDLLADLEFDASPDKHQIDSYQESIGEHINTLRRRSTYSIKGEHGLGNPYHNKSCFSSSYDLGGQNMLEQDIELSGVLGAMVLEPPAENHRNATLDYALIVTKETEHPSFSNRFEYHDGSSTRAIEISDYAPIPASERKILAISGLKGVMTGTLIPGAMSWRRQNSHQFQDIYAIKLDQRISHGDSGSAVVDFESGKFYGHIILGSPGSKVAYIVAATDVLSHIFHSFGKHAAFDLNTRGKVLTCIRAEIESTRTADDHQLNCAGPVQVQTGKRSLIPSKSKVFHQDPSSHTFFTPENCKLGFWDVIALIVNKMIGEKPTN